ARLRPAPALALAVGTDALELDRVVLDEEAGRRPDPRLAETEVGVLEVDAPPAHPAHDVVVVRELRPLVAAAALAPVDPRDLPLGLEARHDPVDGRVRGQRQPLPHMQVELL